MWGRWPDSHCNGGAVSGTPELARHELYWSEHLFSWFRADYRAESGGKVTAIGDKVALPGGAVAPNARSISTSHVLSQANALYQFAAPSPHASFGGRLALSTSTTHLYTSSIAPINWGFLSDGISGGQIIFIGRPTVDGRYYWATTSGPFNPGAAMYTTAQKLGVFSMANGGYAVNTSGGDALLNVASYASWKLKSADTPQYQIRSKRAVGASGAVANAPATGLPSPLCLFARADFAGPFQGQWVEALVKKTPFTVAEYARLERYAQLYYGIPPV
jgi:hypothetical protein